MTSSIVFKEKHLAEEVGITICTLPTGRIGHRQVQIAHMCDDSQMIQCLLLSLPFSLFASQNHFSIPAVTIKFTIPVFHMHIHSDSCPSFYLKFDQSICKCSENTLRLAVLCVLLFFCVVYLLCTDTASWPRAVVCAIQFIVLHSFCLILHNWVIHCISFNEV